VTSQTDVNQQVSNIDYTNQLLGTVDPFGRPGVMLSPAVTINGAGHRRKTFNFYEDEARRMRVESDLHAEGDRLLKSRETRDQAGRITLTETSENGSSYSVSSRAVYEQGGRVTFASNPYRATTAQTDGWVRSTRDFAGRVTEVATFRGTEKPAAEAACDANPFCTGKVVTAFYAEYTTVTDQAGKSRRSKVDGLGRLVRVDEPNSAGSLGETAAPTQPTCYAYDALSNLVEVRQGGQWQAQNGAWKCVGGQLRFFMYDSLSRLVRAKNPEQQANGNLVVSDPVTGNGEWSLGYSYDANGNVSSKVDARNVTSTYTYDGLNRNVTVDYSDTTNISPDITRVYDGATNGKGRLSHEYKGDNLMTAAQLELSAIEAYDALGRPLTGRQMFKTNGVWSGSFQTQRSYHLTGSVKTQTYPSGRTVTYTQDDAGRVSSYTGNLGDGVSRTYATGFSYDAAGRMTREGFGTQTPLYHKRHYNSRGQLFDVRLAAAADEWAWNRGALINYYDSGYHWSNTGGQDSGPDNNGNVTRAQSWVPGDDAVSTHTLFDNYYSYDSLNRISSTSEYKSGTGVTPNTHVFTQAFTYDVWGNRTIKQADTTQTLAPEMRKDFKVDALTNQLIVPDGQPAGVLMAYDPAGNLVTDTYTGSGARAYDAENRMTSAQGASISTGTFTNVYTYDAAGRRTRRKTEGGEVWQVYGLDGELIAEYESGAAPVVPQKEYGYRNGELLVTSEGTTTATTGDWVWVEDALPAGAQAVVGGTNEAWNWTTSSPSAVSGASSNRSPATAGQHQQVFQNATQTMAVGAGDNLVAFVYLDPANQPGEIMLQWNDGASWEHRAYWGVNYIQWGVDGTESRRRMGALPAVGKWVRLEVPAAAVGLAGQTVSGLALTLYGGRANWDRIGKAAVGSPQWLVTDHLGTPRLIADQTGSLAGIRRHDYLPFGEEVGAGVGGRTIHNPCER
ncbi:MAG TPA: hypothetical protein VF527_20015, partial [Pyrinomonadaceae bacterium]|jgi:YD repeat-containing protein